MRQFGYLQGSYQDACQQNIKKNVPTGFWGPEKLFSRTVTKCK